MTTRILPPPSLLSWWCGLSREAFQREIATREEQWRQAKKTPTDGVGAQLREGWMYERRSLETRRTA